MKLHIKSVILPLEALITTSSAKFCSKKSSKKSITMAAKKTEDVKTVDVFTAKGLLEVGYKYLDVRTKDEFEKSHVNDAVNVPYFFFAEQGKEVNPEFLNEVSLICNKEDKLVVGCNGGARSLRACVDLLNAGYENPTNMDGGYSTWLREGLSGDKADAKLAIGCKSSS